MKSPREIVATKAISGSSGAGIEAALPLAELSWIMLSETARLLNITCGRSKPEDGRPAECFEALKWDILELADGIYDSLADDARRAEDDDLERFEQSRVIRGHFSTRVYALALLTYATAMVELKIP